MGQDSLTLQKAEVFAKIAAAIAATGAVDPSVFEETKEKVEATTGKASLERKPAPKKVVGTAKVETQAAPEPEPKPVPEWLTSQEFAVLKELENEPADKKAARLDYLIGTYGSKPMKELPPETFAYFHLEKRELDLMKYYLGTWNADPERWTIKAATEISDNRVTTIGELTVEEYLTKLIPAVGNLVYLLSFEEDQHAELLNVMNQVSKGTVKKLDDLRFRTIEFIRISVDSVIDGTYEDIAKVS